MNPAEIRSAIAAQLETQIEGLRVYSRIPAAPLVPCAMVELGATDRRVDTAGNIQINWSVLFIVSRLDDARAQDALDEFIGTDTDSSAYAAFDHDSTLDGTVDYSFATNTDDPGVFTFGADEYIGVRFHMESMIS